MPLYFNNPLMNLKKLPLAEKKLKFFYISTGHNNKDCVKKNI